MKMSGKLYKCNNCLKKKQLVEFYLSKGKKNTNTCRKCSREKAVEYRDKNRDRINNTHKEWSDRNRESERKRLLEYSRLNKESYAHRNAQWRKDNPDLNCAKSAAYRARKLNQCPKWLSDSDVSRLKSIYKLCKNITKKTGILHHVDHIVPLKGEMVCGLHVPWNLQVIPASQNLSKSNSFDEDMI